MRAGLPIALLLALLAVAATLWLSREPSAPPGLTRAMPGAHARPEEATPAAELRESEARAAATVLEPAGSPPPAVPSTPVGSASVAGRLRLEGGPPGEAVTLQLGSLLVNGGRSIFDQVQAAPGGGFRFDGLADDWSGAVVLPELYQLAYPEEHGGSGGAFPARAGQLGLVIDVVRLPAVRGRALQSDFTPAVDVSIIVLTGNASTTSIWSTRTDADGRFLRPLHGDLDRQPLLELALTFRAEDGTSFHREWTAATLPERDLHGDIQLGDLFLTPAETARVLVLGPAGEPFEGAQVVEIGTPDARTVATDADGLAEVQIVAKVEGFEVRADGFGLVELPRPLPGAQLVAQLVATNVLSVAVVDARGEPWPHGRLRVHSAQPAFEGDRDMPTTRIAGVGSGHQVSSGRDREGAFAEFTTGPEGRVDWPGLVVGQALELTVLDALDTPAVHASVPGLAAGERRAVRLQLSGEPQSASGRCIDAAGNGIAGAALRFSAQEGGSTRVETDADGAFRSPPLLVQRVDLRASAAGFADRELKDQALQAGLTLRLERGRGLRVALRDAQGVPITVGQLQARASGTTWRSSRREPGRHAFEGVPDVALELEHTWHGRTHTTAVPDGAAEFEWELPTLGRLEVEVAPCAIGEFESGYLLLEALDGRRVVQQELLRSGESGHFRFEAWPGSYRLRRSLTFYTADAGGWRKPAGGRDIGEPVEVEVLAGHSVQAELEPVP